MTSFFISSFPFFCSPLCSNGTDPGQGLHPLLLGLLVDFPGLGFLPSFVPLQVLQTKGIGLRIIYDHVNSFHDFHCLEENTSKFHVKPFINWTHFYLCNLVIFNQDQNLLFYLTGDIGQCLQTFLMVTMGVCMGVCTGIQWVEARHTIKQSTMHQTALHNKEMNKMDVVLSWRSSCSYLICHFSVRPGPSHRNYLPS